MATNALMIKVLMIAARLMAILTPIHLNKISKFVTIKTPVHRHT